MKVVIVSVTAKPAVKSYIERAMEAEQFVVKSTEQPMHPDLLSAFKSNVDSEILANRVIANWRISDYDYETWANIQEVAATCKLKLSDSWNKNPSASFRGTYIRWRRDFYHMIAVKARRKMQELYDQKMMMESLPKITVGKDTVTFLHNTLSDAWQKQALATTKIDPRVQSYLQAHGGRVFTLPADAPKPADGEQIVDAMMRLEEVLPETLHTLRQMFPGMLANQQKK